MAGAGGDGMDFLAQQVGAFACFLYAVVLVFTLLQKQLYNCCRLGRRRNRTRWVSLAPAELSSIESRLEKVTLQHGVAGLAWRIVYSVLHACVQALSVETGETEM